MIEMAYENVLVALYALLILFCVVFLFKEEAKKLYEVLSSWKPTIDQDTLKYLFLFGLGLYLFFAGHQWTYVDGFTGLILQFLGLFSFYALIRDLSPTVNGISFPNAYKIVIAIIAFFAVGAIVTGYVQATWAENTAEAIGAIFDGINGLVDTFFDNLDQIKDFLEWWKDFNGITVETSPV